MNFLDTLPEWGADEAQWWRSIVDTPLGVKLMQRLAYFRPSLPPPSGDSNFAAQHAMFVAGYEAAVRELFDMRKASESEVKSPPEAYPDLDDNTKWQDKTNP